MSQREKDDRPSSYVYDPVYIRHVQNKVHPLRYAWESKFGIQYKLANHFAGARCQVSFCGRNEVPRDCAFNRRIDQRRYPVSYSYP